jgi:hypothetical protein
MTWVDLDDFDFHFDFDEIQNFTGGVALRF